MITLTVRPARTSFSGPEKELKQMFKVLRVKDKNNYWRQLAALKRVAYFKNVKKESKRQKLIEKLKNSTKWVKFYDRRSDTFATGLLERVIGKMGEAIDFRIEDKRKPFPRLEPIKKFRFVDEVENRPEQLEAVNVALQKGRGILHCATNAGKTECACAIISEYARQTGRVPRVLFLIHRAGLVQQTMDRFKKHLPESFRVEMLGAGKKAIGRKSRIVVATVQTSSNLSEDFYFQEFQEKCEILFIDEFHLNKAWQCSRIVKNNAAMMRLGLSGTIDEKNKIKMLHYVGMTGPVIAEIRNKELVDLGRSAKPVIRFIEVGAKHISKKRGFAQGYRLGVVKNLDRNDLVVREALRYLKKDYKTLITVSRISHGITLKSMIERKLDFRVEFLSGSSSLHRRKKVIREFEKGKVAVLIASPIFDTGVDIPAIQAWVNAAGGRGWELVLQRLGRVLRKKEGDNRVFISDFVDKHNPYLMRHSMARIRHYIREKIADIEVVE